MWNILFWTFCICFLTLQKKYENIKYFISCWRPSQCGGAEDGWIIYEARALSSVFRDILPFFWDKYILQFETNTLCNLRQLNHLWGDSSQLRFLETLHLHLQNVVLPISFVSPQILLSTFIEYFHVNICKCYRQTCLCLFWFSIHFCKFFVFVQFTDFLWPATMLSMDYCSVFYPGPPLIPRDVS